MIPLPPIRDLARWTLRGAAILLVAWTIYAAGQHSMAKLALEAIGDGDYCAALLSDALDAGERAGAALAERSIAQRWVIAMKGRGEMVATNTIEEDR